ncbi:MAG: CHAT domain-containing protein [Candidatus Methanoperedens sp.]|nr:CHAT domain-containing protein [Candidatus Methanoperedens sp.]
MSVKKSAIIANDYDGKLKCVALEKENIENILKRKGIEIIPIKPKRLEILELLSDKVINLFHFACDSTYNELSPNDSDIKLSDYGLKAKDIGVSSLKKGHPLIFLNSCQSGMIDYEFSGIGGFSKAFLDAGALAFVGTIWKIPDELSMKFSEEFYKNVFENEMSLGESLRETKRKLRTLKNPAWLSYSLYSFPLAKVTV